MAIVNLRGEERATFRNASHALLEDRAIPRGYPDHSLTHQKITCYLLSSDVV